MRIYCKALLILFTAIIVLNSCKSSKSSISDTNISEISNTREYFKTMLDNEPVYKSLSCKMNIELQSGEKKISSKASLKLVKDKVLQISISAPIIGTEIFRVTLTPDSIIALDRYHQQYVVEDISVFKTKNLDLDFNALQSLFTNRLFIPGKSEVTKSDYSAFGVNRKDNQTFLTLKGSKKLNYTFAGNTACKITSSLIEITASDYRVDWKYSDFGDLAGTRFPFKMNVFVTGKNSLNVNFSFSKIEKDTNVSVDYSVPGKYRRVDINDLIKIFVK